jgi:hypothetical protein
MNPKEYIDLLLENAENGLKAILDSDKAYEILDNIEGGTWMQGGCAILAFALKQLYNYEVYVIFNTDKNTSEHFIAKDRNNYFWDYDGKHLGNEEFLDEYKEAEMIKGELKLIKWNDKIKSDGIPINHTAIAELVELIKSENN